ncbi:MAG: pyridoxal phosphate-dependent aminotransferase [Herbinix sp.]|nr:pyridoxal phosphate-dependent aminotransferase [Herbinix sp.]
MSYNFNNLIDRTNTNSLKYDFALERGKPTDILPLWVADMDFQAPTEILDEIHKAVSHGIFGYSDVKQDYFNVVHDWFYRHFNWDTKENWLIKTPGVVYAIAMAVRALTEEGDGVLIQQPVYYPFQETIRLNNRKLVVNSLVYQDGKYSIDFDDFERKIISENVKLFILCNPHNPVGRVWSESELTRLGNICIEHNVIIVSDEIHCDFTYPGFLHTVFAGINDTFAENTITCTAPSKTFNLAGLQVSNIFIKNEVIRQKIKAEISKSGYCQLNTLGLVASKAAYQYGEPWLNELKAYLYDNLNFVRDFLKERLPMIKLVEPQGTYLIWLDFSQLNYSKKEMEDLIVNKAKLWLDPGHIFGKDGEGFERINIACPREILKKAFEQLENAINEMMIFNNKTQTNMLNFIQK